MAKCMFAVTYSPEGAQGLVKDGGTRSRAYIAELIAGLGAKLEAFYYAFGDTDVITIVDAPDTATIAALSLAVNASGAAKLTTTMLATPEEIDQAVKKTVGYRPPGRS